MKKLIFIIIPLIAFGFLLAVFCIPNDQKMQVQAHPDPGWLAGWNLCLN